MTRQNREVFLRDPTTTKIPNDGVAKVVRASTEQQMEVLRWELGSFVCEGQYEAGLRCILDSFTRNLDETEQPGVWVSGFYGSGKSHLVRVLEHLWRDLEMPGGERARQLATFSDEIGAHLRELSTEGTRQGGLWSAAGTLASGAAGAPRLAFLSVLFESAGLPEQYPLARFELWARENGYLDGVKAAVSAEERDYDREIHDLYVSPVIAGALLKADPTLGDSAKDVRRLLQAQFPPATKDIDRGEMLDTMERVLALVSTTEGKVPLTLVVLDEMQQYIGDDIDRALDVAFIAEDCTARFASRVLIVATGQSELTATPVLQRLTDRFTLPVALSDQDVNTVIRRVVLGKKPEHKAEIESTLDAARGEIDTHLGGTQLAAKAEDEDHMVADYPLLATRRRFWEMALRAIDRGSKAGVLRTQLRMVHEAAAGVGDRPVGHVVGGDFIFEAQSTGMVQSGVLLREINEVIQRMRTNGSDGVLQSRICALIFLISQIPKQGASGETGLRATAPFIADLLVEDLTSDGAVLRQRVPEVLDELVEAGHVMQIDDEYRLQTEEGAEWEKDLRRNLANIRVDAARMTQLRSDRLIAAAEGALAGLKPAHGASKIVRPIAVHWGQDEPSSDDGAIPVWIRDEWSVSDAAVKSIAAVAGDESPVVYVLLPKHEADQLKDALASSAAASATLQRPVPQTDEGRTAQRSMQTRLAVDDERVTALVSEVVRRARVFQGGGAEITTTSLRGGVETAARRSLIRLFPRFDAGDHANWSKVVTRARDGAHDALEAVDHLGDPTDHPVGKEVLAAVSASGTKGSELVKRFTAPGFGWPTDAVRGALLTLMATGHIRAALDGKEISGPKGLAPSQIGKATFYKEDEPPSVTQRLKLTNLLQTAGISFDKGQESAQIPALLRHLKDLADRAGGPAPLPTNPDTSHMDTYLAQSGNQRFRAVADDHARLKSNIEDWRASGEARERRQVQWDLLNRLLRHAEGLEVEASVRPGVKAVTSGRQLLEEPDPAKPLIDQLMSTLRAEVTGRADQLRSAQRSATSELAMGDDWARLPQTDQDAVLAQSHLVEEAAPDVATTDALAHALDGSPLSAWDDRIALVPGRRDQARQRVAQILEPESTSVQLAGATLKTPADLEAFLDGIRAQVSPRLADGQTVIVS